MDPGFRRDDRLLMVAGMDARRGPFDDFTIATAVLTRLPIGTATTEHGTIGAAGWAFPLVGAGVGALAALAFLFAELVGLGPAPAAMLAVAASLVVTGAFHEDGLADTADGFGGGGEREQKLAIMRDSRHGTYGVLAIVLSIGLRAAALGSIAGPIYAGLALLAAHSFSRGILPTAMYALEPARADGLGAMAGRPSLAVAVIAAAIGIVIALAVLGPTRGLAAVILAGGAVALAALLARRQVGGYTGDVLGAFQQIGEIVMLLVAAAAR
jgi:adenosylcobinamide-GDP ribazoletransferase